MNQVLKILFSFTLLFCFSITQAQSLSIVSWNLKDFGQSRDDQEIKLIAEDTLYSNFATNIKIAL